jgi:hypothetical protein
MEKKQLIMPITSRLQKGGALLADMRLLVIAASREPQVATSVAAARRVLTKDTANRVHQTYIRAFRPRFVRGSPPDAWCLAAVLESLTPDPNLVRPFYYWITARAEPLLREFVSTELFDRMGSADREVRVGEVLAWMTGRLQAAGKRWTPTVQRKVARGILAALRDFGLLEGVGRKRLAFFHLAPEIFALIAFLLHEMGAEAGRLVAHPDWRLFLLGETAVEGLFLECHQRRWLRYQVAGALHRVEFPKENFEEYAHELLGPRD